MDDSWQQLPRAAVIVCVGVIGAGASRPVRAEHEAEAAPTSLAVDVDDQLPVAPTCGPQCHTPGYWEANPPPPPNPDDRDDEDRESPPPVEPGKKGCTIEDAESDDAGLALLGLGLLAGVGARRRRNHRERP